MATDGLQGRVAVVTGALGTLGSVWSGAFAEVGATVVGIDLQAADAVLRADVTDRRSLERILADVLREHGPPAVLVNNAGIDVPPGGSDDSTFAKTLDVNVTGVFNATEVFGRAMCDAGRGSIVNIGSLYASIAPIPALYDHIDPPFTKPAAYGASKAGAARTTSSFASTRSACRSVALPSPTTWSGRCSSSRPTRPRT
jgi:NAD(P)-dependent dehydrogenase (short-subunit alcohol dehydrogenase family)